MKPIHLFPLALVSGLPFLNAQTNGIDQALNFITPPTGGQFIQWQAKAGRSYFLQISDPADHLKKWNWSTLIESGNNQSISYEVDGTADKGFFRLHYTDQTATDLDNADFDADGLTNLQEITPVVRPNTRAARRIGGGTQPANSTQTNPLDEDTDHDGLGDKFERDNNLDPTDDGSGDPNNGPNGDPDGDGISNQAQQTLIINDSDGDSLANSEDADPQEVLVNWRKAPESSYALIDLDVPSDAGDASDLNDKGEVLFENGIWAGGEWLSKTPPEVTGIIPENPANPDDQDWPYEILFDNYGWSFFNNDRNLLQVPWLRPTDGPGVDSGTLCPIFWPNGQSHPSVIFETADRWTPYISYARALGVSSNGDMTVRVTPRIPSGMPQVRQIERYNAQGAAAGIMDGTDGFHPDGASYGHGQMTPSGWVVSNLSRDASGNEPSADKIGLWDSSNAAVPLPEQAEGWGYPVTATDMPNGKVGIIAGQGSVGRVFLPNASGQYQYVASLAAGGLERFAGDGTAITQDGQLWRNGKLTPLQELCKRYGELLEADWTFRTLKANQQGIYLIQAQGPNGEQEAKLLIPVEVISDLNNDGKITTADNLLRDAAMASGASDEIKDKCTEFIFHNDQLSNGIWDKEDNDPARPATEKDDDDAEEISINPGITEGEVWLDHPAIAGLSFYKTRECNAADKVNLSPTSKFTVSASNPFPAKLYMRADGTLTYPDANPQFEGDLVLKIKVGTAGQEIEATKMKLTVVKQLGAKKYFHTVRDYIFENNTKTFTQEKAYGASTKYRIVGMREESTFMSGLDTYDHAADAPRLRGIDEVKANYTSDVIINGNQCFFHDDRNPYIAGLTAQMTNRCEGRLCVARNILRPPSNDTHNPNLGGPGARYVGYTGGEPQIINGQVTVPSEFNFATGQIPEAVPATPDHGIGGLAAKYDRQELQDSENQAIGRGPAIEQGKGIIFTATTYVGNPGNAKDFAADARKSGVKPLSGGDGSQWELLFLDGSSSVGLILTNPQGVQKTVIKGGKHTGAPYYYINTYLLFECQKVRN